MIASLRSFFLSFAVSIIYSEAKYSSAAFFSYHARDGRTRVKTLFQRHEKNGEDLSRREILAIVVVGGFGYAKIASSALSKIKRGDAYPEEHENRVSNIFQTAILEASLSVGSHGLKGPLRILEVGIGKNCRTVLRGLYDDALAQLSLLSDKSFIYGIEFTAVDFDIPTNDILQSVRSKLSASSLSLPVTFDIVKGDIVKGLDFPCRYFGAFQSTQFIIFMNLLSFPCQGISNTYRYKFF
jgi:hypothetical protein